jgi:hypothetical protein
LEKNQVAGLMRSFLVSAGACLFLVSISFSEEGPNVPLADPLEKTTLHTKYAKERLVELKAMISKG